MNLNQQEHWIHAQQQLELPPAGRSSARGFHSKSLELVSQKYKDLVCFCCLARVQNYFSLKSGSRGEAGSAVMWGLRDSWECQECCRATQRTPTHCRSIHELSSRGSSWQTQPKGDVCSCFACGAKQVGPFLHFARPTKLSLVFKTSVTHNITKWWTTAPASVCFHKHMEWDTADISCFSAALRTENVTAFFCCSNDENVPMLD